MQKIKHQDPLSELAESLKADLMRQYGPLLSGDALRKVLGYPSLAAMRQAVFRNKIPVPIFSIENRRGKFALAEDVAYWLAKQRSQADNSCDKEGGEGIEEE